VCAQNDNLAGFDRAGDLTDDVGAVGSVERVAVGGEAGALKGRLDVVAGENGARGVGLAGEQGRRRVLAREVPCVTLEAAAADEAEKVVDVVAAHAELGLGNIVQQLLVRARDVADGLLGKRNYLDCADGVKEFVHGGGLERALGLEQRTGNFVVCLLLLLPDNLQLVGGQCGDQIIPVLRRLDWVYLFFKKKKKKITCSENELSAKK